MKANIKIITGKEKVYIIFSKINLDMKENGKIMSEKDLVYYMRIIK